MDEFLSSLQRLIDSKRLQPAERIICDHLINYESILPKTIDDDLFSKTESILINLLSVNKGELSIQCSIRIGICLLHLYRSKEVSRQNNQNESSQDRSEKTWNLFAAVAKKPEIANIYATGFIIKFLGKNFTSKITSFAKNLLNLTKYSNLTQPILYALNFCFKRARKEMNDNTFFDKTLKLALKVLQASNSSTSNSISNETEQMLTIRLLRTLINPKSTINLNSAIFQKVLNSIKTLMEDSSSFSPFAREETSFLIAKYLIRDLTISADDDSLYSININDKETNKSDNHNFDDFKINSIDKSQENQEQEKLNKSLSFLVHEFPNQVYNIFRKLLLMVSPSYIHQNIDVFFSFISKNIPEDLPHLIDLISNDDRKILFDKVESIKDHYSADNLFMMKILSNDQEAMNLTAAAAFQMITKKSDQLKEAAANFFTRLAIKSIDISSPYVQASTSFLSTPPDVSQNITREVKGYAIVVATIISQRPELSYQFRQQIQTAISYGLKSGKMLEGHFQAAFTLMAGVPKETKENNNDTDNDDPYKYSDSSSFFSLEEADKALELFCNYFDSNEILNDNNIYLCQGLCAQIAMFIVQYPRLKNSMRAILTIYNNDDLHSLQFQCCVLKAFGDLVLNQDSEKFAVVIGRNLRSLINSIAPPVDFVFHSLKSPMISPPMLLKSTPIINREIPPVFIQAHQNTFAQNAIILYPKFILSLPEEMGRSFVSLLFMNQLINYKMSPILLLFLLRNQKTADMLHDISFNNNSYPNSEIKSSFLNCLFAALKSAAADFSKNKSPSNPALSVLANSLKQSTSSNSLLNQNISLTSLSSSAANFCYTCASVSSMNDIQLTLKMQTLSECIALYTSQHSKLYLNPVLNHIMKYKTSREKCFLLAALFSYVKDIPEETILNIMIELNNIAMTSGYQAYALFALMIMYQNYMVQLSLIPFTSNQVDFFFGLFQLQGSLSPFNMYYMAQSFNALTLILSPEIKTKEDKSKSNQSILNTIKNIIFCFANSEVPFSRGVYYHVLRAAFAFERDLVFSTKSDYLSANSDSNSNSYLYSISSFPISRGTSLSLKTAACGVFSDYAKMIDPTIDFFNLIPQVIMILQTTSDARASDFILTLVKNFINNSKGIENDSKVRKRLKEWVKLIRLCNSKGVLPGTPDVSAGISVRRVCTSIAIDLLSLLSRSEPLMSDCIDDIISSAIDSLIRNENEYSYLAIQLNSHANMQFDLSSHPNFDWSSHLTRRSIDNSANTLQADNFKLFVEIIKTFGNFKDETGKRILDLYDSQFSTALKIAFSSSNLSISGNFLSTFLLFHINDLSVDESALNGFIECMSNTKSVLKLNYSSLFSPSSNSYGAFESAYLSIAAQLVSIAQKNEKIYEKIKKLTIEFLYHFNQAFVYSRSLWYENVDDLPKMSLDPNTNTNSNFLASKWSEISAFRSMFSSCYAKIISSLVWLINTFKKRQEEETKSKTENEIVESESSESTDELSSSILQTEIVKVEEISYFVIADIIHCQEAWRINASLVGLASLVEYEMIDLDLLTRFLNAVLTSTRIIQAAEFSCFILACAKGSNSEGIWSIVTNLFLSMEQLKKESSVTLAYLINNGTNEQVLEKSDAFFKIIENNYEEVDAMLLLTLLFDKSKEKVDDFLFQILSKKDEESKNGYKRSDSFKFEAIYRSLKRNKCEKSMKLIDDFSISQFMNGGCELMGYVLLTQSESNPSGGFLCHFFEDDRFYEFYQKSALFENLEDSKNSDNSEKKIIPSSALKMLQLGYALISFKELRNNDKLITSILSFSLNYIAESVTSVELSKKLAKWGALIWREVNKNDKMMLKVTFKNFGIEKGKKLVSKVEKASPLREKRTLSLKTFAEPKQLRRLHTTNDSWQDLTATDDK